MCSVSGTKLVLYLGFRGTRSHIPELSNLNWMYQGGSTGCKDAHCKFLCSVSSVSHEKQVMYALKVELGVWRPVTQHTGCDGHQPVTAYRIWLVIGQCHSSRVWLPASHRRAPACMPGKSTCELWWTNWYWDFFSLLVIRLSPVACRSTVGLVVLMGYGGGDGFDKIV